MKTAEEAIRRLDKELGILRNILKLGEKNPSIWDLEYVKAFIQESNPDLLGEKGI